MYRFGKWMQRARSQENANWGIDQKVLRAKGLGDTFTSGFFFSPWRLCHSAPQEKETFFCLSIPTALWNPGLRAETYNEDEHSACCLLGFWLLEWDKWWKQHITAATLSTFMCWSHCKHFSTPISSAKPFKKSGAWSSKFEQKIIIFIFPLSSFCHKSLFLSGQGADPPARAKLQILLIDLTE